MGGQFIFTSPPSFGGEVQSLDNVHRPVFVSKTGSGFVSALVSGRWIQPLRGRHPPSGCVYSRRISESFDIALVTISFWFGDCTLDKRVAVMFHISGIP